MDANNGYSTRWLLTLNFSKGVAHRDGDHFLRLWERRGWGSTDIVLSLLLPIVQLWLYSRYLHNAPPTLGLLLWGSQLCPDLYTLLSSADCTSQTGIQNRNSPTHMYWDSNKKNRLCHAYVPNKEIKPQLMALRLIWSHKILQSIRISLLLAGSSTYKKKVVPSCLSWERKLFKLVCASLSEWWHQFTSIYLQSVKSQLSVNIWISAKRVWYESNIWLWFSYLLLPISKNDAAETHDNLKAFCRVGWDFSYWGHSACR